MNKKYKNDLFESYFQKEDVLVACHRGTAGGNIIFNTVEAFENSLLHGADMIEVDVSKSTDGVFYSFHDGGEKVMLGVDQNINTLSSKEIDNLVLMNSVGLSDNKKVDRFSDILEKFNNRCLINVDRAWVYDNWDDFLVELKSCKNLEQILLKSPVKDEYLEALEKSGLSVMYMPIVYNRQEVEKVLSYDINLVALEIIFDSLDHELIEKDYINSLKERGIHLWVNAITLKNDGKLSANLGDNNAILNSPEDNYGTLIDLGFDIIQTDWPSVLKPYLKNRKGRN